MQTGTKISGIAHVTLLGWAVFGGAFRSEPLPFEVQDVSVITEEQFRAISAPREAPDVNDVPAELQEPENEETAVALPAPDQPEPEQSRPEPVPVPEAQPEPVPEVIEAPEPDLTEDAPALDQPEPDIVALPEPPGQRPKPRPVERLAPKPVAPPPPDVQPDEVDTPPVAADEGAEVEQEEQEAKAPPEATDRRDPEAEETTELAPTRAPRPPARPRRPQRPTQAAETPAPAPDRSQAVDDALAEALGGAETTASAPAGPPLSSGERDAFRVAVQNCWIVDVGSQAANVTITVGMEMKPDGTVVNGSLHQISADGGNAAAIRAAFDAARRAILRCQKGGYDLPKDKFGHWREIEITFDPSRMRNR